MRIRRFGWIIFILIVIQLCMNTSGTTITVGEDVTGGDAAIDQTTTTTSQPTPPWIPSFSQLARTIVRLPWNDSTVDEQAVQLIRTYRSGSYGQTADWTYRIGRLFIPRWEFRVFPDARELLRERPSFRESTDMISFEESVDTEEDFDEGDKPKLFRANLIHVLAGRGFDRAIKEVFSYMTPTQIRSTLEAGCGVAATLNLDDATPLHILSLYAPDTPLSSGHGNVVTAESLLLHGANFSATCKPAELNLVPMALAAERGNIHLFTYFLTDQIPSTYHLTPEEIIRTTEEQAAYDDYLYHFNEIVQSHETDTSNTRLNATEWRTYLQWLDGHRPRTAGQLESERFEKNLIQTFQLAAMSNRIDIIRLILTGPSNGYHMIDHINDRSHNGRGDCVLHGVIIHGFKELAELLLEYGADPTLLSHDHLTLHQLAVQYRQLDMVPFIDEVMKKIKPPPKSRKETDAKKSKNRAKVSSGDATITHDSPTPTTSHPTPSTDNSSPPTTSESSTPSTVTKTPYQLAKEKHAATAAAANERKKEVKKDQPSANKKQADGTRTNTESSTTTTNTDSNQPIEHDEL